MTKDMLSRGPPAYRAGCELQPTTSTFFSCSLPTPTVRDGVLGKLDESRQTLSDVQSKLQTMRQAESAPGLSDIAREKRRASVKKSVRIEKRCGALVVEFSHKLRLVEGIMEAKGELEMGRIERKSER